MTGSRPPMPDPAHDALILEVLREVLARQTSAASGVDVVERGSGAAVGSDALTQPTSASAVAPAERTSSSPTSPSPAWPASPPAGGRLWTDPESGLTRAELDRIAEYEAQANEPPEPSIQVARSLRRLLVGVVIAVAIVNVPLVNGRTLTQAMPDRTALIVRDGLLIKGAGPEVFVLEDGKKRWIHSLDVFEARGLDWADVHTVDARYLATFPDGRPVYQLLKCPDSPHVYRIEDGHKRWIKDVPTLQAEGHVWEDVETWPCHGLADIPFGPPIPEDAGWPDEDASTGDLAATPEP